MKRYRVHVAFPCGIRPDTATIDFPDDYSEDQIEAICADFVQEMLGNLDSGWHPIDVDNTKADFSYCDDAAEEP